MRKGKNLPANLEDNLITRIIKSLKKILCVKKKEKNVELNRTAQVLTAEKINVKLKKSISQEDLENMEKNILENISYIDKLDEEELMSLDDYYDIRIAELENKLNNKKSSYYKVMSKRA